MASAAWDDGKHTGVRTLRVVAGSLIHSIQVEYDLKGNSVWAERHGGAGETNDQEVKLNPDEYLISVSGYYVVSSYENVVRSLKFKSNLRTYGPFGIELGRFFSATAPEGGRIVGFHGRSGDFLTSIEPHFDQTAGTDQTPSEGQEGGQATSVGPYGGQGGEKWDDGKENTGIRHIELAYDSRIHSIRIEYDDTGSSSWSGKHGGHGGSTKISIPINHPDEYLISVSGYYSLGSSDVSINSLTFQTNKRTHGPYGPEMGRHFSLSSPKSKIIGFHGRSGAYLDSIGAHLVPIKTDDLTNRETGEVDEGNKPTNSDEGSQEGRLVSVGPFGGPGGVAWDDGKEYTGVKHILIAYDTRVHSIKVEYDDTGSSIWSDRRGGDGGAEKFPVKFNYPGEYLVSISGYLSEEPSMVSVLALTFHTNQGKYGPYGTEVGKPFSLSSPNSKIIGFYGRSGAYLDALGVHMVPTEKRQQIAGPAITEPTKFGPTESQGGVAWDDRNEYTGVRQVQVAYDSSLIRSIRVEYDDYGSSMWAQRRGGDGGTQVPVKLNYPDEYLISVSGYCSEGPSNQTIHSLTFETNKNSYGPYGKEVGKPFSFSSSNGKIVGFHGRSGAYLDSIGVYMVPVTGGM